MKLPIKDGSTPTNCDQPLSIITERSVSRYTRFVYTCATSVFPYLFKVPCGSPVRPLALTPETNSTTTEG